MQCSMQRGARRGGRGEVGEAWHDMALRGGVKGGGGGSEKKIHVAASVVPGLSSGAGRLSHQATLAATTTDNGQQGFVEGEVGAEAARQ